MSKALKNVTFFMFLTIIVAVSGLGFARQFAPELYFGFKQGMMKLPLAQKASYTLPSLPPILAGGSGLIQDFQEEGLFPLPEPEDLTREEEMRGVWVATVLSIDFPKIQGNAEQQKQELINILNTAKEAGLNTVFFQVRPHGDAFYPSELFPWSSYLTGTAGQDPGYDPLAFVLEEADKRGLRVHAWINPYRLTMGSKDKPQNTNEFLPVGSPVKNRPDLTMACGDGKLYLNPGEPEAMQLVVDGVKEIIEKYNVDGIHFDDYFYPSDASYNDSAAYEKYGKPQGLSLEDWRRQNTTALMKMVKEAIKESRPGIEFGISPSGIWQNKKSSPLGSDTNGFESYNRIYADSRLWVTDEVVDYIVPQIYWAIGTTGSDYDVLARWWREVALGTKVKLYIGHAAYRVGSEGAWLNPTEMGRQITLNRALGAIDGSVFYGYKQIAENTLGLRDQLKDFFIDMELAQPLKIVYPASGYATNAANSFIIGSADPRYPLYLNGQPVDRTVSGYFSLYVPLEVGDNKFTFKFQDQEQEYSLLRNQVITPPAGSGGGSGSGSQGPKITQFEKPLVYMTKEDQTVVRAAASSSATRLQPLKKGVRGYVVAESNGYYLMDSGNWTYKPNVEILNDASLPACQMGSAQIAPGQSSVAVSFQVPYFASYYVDMTDEEIWLTVHQTKGQPMTRQGEDPLFGEVTFTQDGAHSVYHMPLKKTGRLYGYTVNYDETAKLLTFFFNNPIMHASAEQPLAGKTIVLDAGHGGSDNGATGPAGDRGKREKELNLEVALVLQGLLKEAGAEVIMTRTDDIYLDLETRANLIRDKKPDLAISLHRNSMGADKDISTYKGVLALYSHQQSAALAQHLSDALVKGTNHYYDGIRWQSLAVCRIEECPAVLLELGFVTNPSEYERMNRVSTINKEAQAILRGIESYLAGS